MNLSLEFKGIHTSLFTRKVQVQKGTENAQVQNIGPKGLSVENQKGACC